MRTSRLLIAIALTLLSARALAAESPRQDTLLQNNWRFIREDVPNAESPAFDDSSWQKVTIPHTWNAVDAQSQANYYRGPAWYRLHLTLKPEDVGPLSAKRNYLRFEAVSTVADVFVNGQKLGQHRGSFGAFCFDASDALKSGENIIAVRADNTKFPDIAPISGDFAIFGGIYRDVHLLTLNDRSIDPLDDASPGVYLLQVSTTPDRALLVVTTKLRNSSAKPWEAATRCLVRDADGKELSTVEVRNETGTLTLPGNATGQTLQSVVFDHPHLWAGHPTTSSPAPYLYTVTIETLNDGKVTDSITQPLGIRSIHLDPDKGFFLNDEHYPLHGANRHQDRQDKGWAISHEDQNEDFDQLLEMGSTGVRLAHYQHSDYAYSLCDKNGLLVWAEIPLVDRVAPTTEFNDNAKQQLRELIKQNFNHPSIICWSVSNELWMGRKDNVGATLPRELYDLAKSIDPYRPIVNADNGPPDYEHNGNTDAIAFNRYYGWYVDKHTDWPGIDDLHIKLPNKAVGISEYGAGANPLHHEVAPDGSVKMPVHNGPWHPEEYQSVLHESAWNVLKSREWLWCTFFWTSFDFATPVRQEGGFQSRNDKGVISYDRKTKKDAFYFYKANWSDDPVVYITSRRFSPRPAGPTNIKVYSNQPTVELFLNDKSLGTLKATDFPDRIFEWKNVELPVGNNRVSAVGTDSSGNASIKDGFAWMCEAAK